MFKLCLSLLLMSIASLSQADPVIMVLGDSISAAYGIQVQQGWVKLLESKIIQEYPQAKVFNESISGDTSTGGLDRLPAALQRSHPSWVLLELGANDGLRGLAPEVIKQNLLNIIQTSQKTGARVMLLGVRIPPNYGKRYTEMFYSVYPQLAAELKLPFLPFIMEDVALNKELMQADGLHPNAAAQPLIAEKIWQSLKPRLGRP
ncbi:MAG: arylesterase [Methylococcaceae bacterium]|nr:arylesterase [Methylococcaceae bacterium]